MRAGMLLTRGRQRESKDEEANDTECDQEDAISARKFKALGPGEKVVPPHSSPSQVSIGLQRAAYLDMALRLLLSHRGGLKPNTGIRTAIMGGIADQSQKRGRGGREKVPERVTERNRKITKG